MLTRRVMFLIEPWRTSRALAMLANKYQPVAFSTASFSQRRFLSKTTTTAQSPDAGAEAGSQSQSSSGTSIDPSEMQRFKLLANNWWIENGEFGALHQMNGIRVPLVRDTMVNYRESLPVKEKEKLKSYLGEYNK